MYGYSLLVGGFVNDGDDRKRDDYEWYAVSRTTASSQSILLYVIYPADTLAYYSGGGFPRAAK